jgi:hypothetical protein
VADDLPAGQVIELTATLERQLWGLTADTLEELRGAIALLPGADPTGVVDTMLRQSAARFRERADRG